MNELLYEEIPSLDLKDFTGNNPELKKKFVEELGKAFNNIGFVAVKNHGLSDDITKRLYALIEKFFALPEDVKVKYERPELAGQRGYIGKKKEQAKGHGTPDLKEFYHIGQTVEDDDHVKDIYPSNIWPDEIPELEKMGTEVFRTLENAGKQMLKAIALYLDLEEDYFEEKVRNGNSILRAIHYFPIDKTADLHPDAVRAAEHGDINLITLLMGASAEGLQVKRRDGKWIPITALPEQIIVNVGDMLDRLTNHKLKSTIHRVVNPPKELLHTSRYSIPFFMHPRSEMDLTCLPGCIDTENPKRYSDMTAGEFLEERLVELGLKKRE